MTDLAKRLSDLDAAAQAQVARQHAPGASIEELVGALVERPLGEVAEFHVLDEIASRGPAPADPLIRALLVDPIARIRWLGEALVELYQHEPSVRARVCAALIDAANAALDAGGGSQGAAPSIQMLRDCARIAGPLPEAAGVATRLLAIAAQETTPYLPATGAAEFLAGESTDVAEQ